MLVSLTAPGARAAGKVAAAPSPGAQCAAAIEAAQRATAIPDGWLASIGQVESGRPDPASKRWLPWPWTIDVGGQGSFFNSAAEAIAAVRALQAQGVRSIDVGCVQINLAQHPDAFQTLDQAFDPVANAAYGARFLTHLYASAHDWIRAAALYHSATPALAEDYARKVLAVRGGGTMPAFALVAASPRPPSRAEQLAAAWSATLDTAADSDPGFSIGPGRTGLGGKLARARPRAALVEVAEAPEGSAHRPVRAGLTGRYGASR